MRNLLLVVLTFLSLDIFSQSIIFSEDFGVPDTDIASSNYTKWQYSSSYKYTTSNIPPLIKSDYKSSGYINASGGGNLGFKGDLVQYLEISGINTMGFADLTINFYAIKLGDEVTDGEISIWVKDNNSEFKKLVLNSDLISVEYGRKTAINIPNSKNLSLRILYTSSNNDVEIRIDDFKLLGCLIPAVPAVTYSPTACMFEVLNLPSNTFVQTIPTGTDINPVNVILTSGNYYLRTVSTTLGCSSVWSSPAKFYVKIDKLPKITKNPTSNVTILNRLSTYNFIASADTTFLWEFSKNNGDSWEVVKNEYPYKINGDTLSISFDDESDEINGYQYRISTYGSTCNVSSTAGRLMVPKYITDNLIALNAEEFFTIIDVSWVTFKEETMEKFIIERSINEINWEFVGSLMAMHNTDDQHKYTFYDNYSLKNNVFYRIKIIKDDGSIVYSPTISINEKEELDSMANKRYYSLLGELVTVFEKDKYYIEVVDGIAIRVVSSK